MLTRVIALTCPARGTVFTFICEDFTCGMCVSIIIASWEWNKLVFKIINFVYLIQDGNA